MGYLALSNEPGAIFLLGNAVTLVLYRFKHKTY